MSSIAGGIRHLPDLVQLRPENVDRVPVDEKDGQGTVGSAGDLTRDRQPGVPCPEDDQPSLRVPPGGSRHTPERSGRTD